MKYQKERDYQKRLEVDLVLYDTSGNGIALRKMGEANQYILTVNNMF